MAGRKMIPKIIHFCWFGNNPKPDIIIKCINSWKKYCPDYEIIEWNESNFDINSNQYVKEAYENKKWAFVSDCVRLYALFTFGGVYLDTDCELLKNIDCFLLHNGVVTGYQEDVSIPAAIIFSNKNNEWIKAMLDYYIDKHFVLENGKCDLTTNSTIITVLSMRKFGFNIGDDTIKFGNVKLFPTIVFAPIAKKKKDALKAKESLFDVNPELTYSIHHGTATWYKKTLKNKIWAFFVGIIRALIGTKNYNRIKARILKKQYLKSNIN